MVKLGGRKKGLAAVMERHRPSAVEAGQQRLIGGGGDLEEAARRRPE